MKKQPYRKGEDRLLLIIGAFIASFILLLSSLAYSPMATSQSRQCIKYCHSEYEKKNTLYRITDMFRKNIEVTECFEECMR
jgi:hypothetical protein